MSDMKNYHLKNIGLLLLIALFLSAHATQAQAFPSGWLDNVVKAIAKLLDNHSDDGARLGREVFEQYSKDATKVISPDDLAKLGDKTPEQIYQQYEMIKDIDPIEAAWWLYQAANKGFYLARLELDRQCRIVPRPKYLANSGYCKTNSLNNHFAFQYAPERSNGDFMYRLYLHDKANQTVALSWLSTAAEQGNANAIAELDKLCLVYPSVTIYCSQNLVRKHFHISTP